MRRIVKGLDVPTPSGDTDDVYTVLKDALRHYFRPSVNLTAERHRFRQTGQQQGEPVSAFVARLREKAEICQFQSTSVNTVENSQIRDQLIAGLQSADMRKQLLLESKLTMADAVSKVVALEASIADSKLFTDIPGSRSASRMATEIHTESNVAALEAATEAKSSTQDSAYASTSERRRRRSGSSCKYCGGSHPYGTSRCPAAHVKCRHCSNVGHFARVCMAKKKAETNAMVTEEVRKDQVQEVCDMAFNMDGTVNSHFTTTLLVNNKPCKGLVDTGATRTILTSDVT